MFDLSNDVDADFPVHSCITFVNLWTINLLGMKNMYVIMPCLHQVSFTHNYNYIDLTLLQCKLVFMLAVVE